MYPHFWKILGGLIRVTALVLPAYLTWTTITYFDAVWNFLFWQRFFHRDIFFAGFIASFIIFYLVGGFAETKLGLWLDNKIFTKIPLLGRLFITLNPKTRELLHNAKGSVIAPFMSGWRHAFLIAVHETEEGYLGSVGYIGIPPIPQQLDEKSRVKIRKMKVGMADGQPVFRYELIPTETALKQELSFGAAVPSDAYKNVVEISFGEFVHSRKLLNNHYGG